MAIHERVWERAAPPPQARAWQPRATYGLLGAMVAVYVVELVLLGRPGAYARTGVGYQAFIIDTQWWLRPWTLVTSTLAHDPTNLWHLLLNGLFLFFLGPLVERILGPRRYVTLFLVAGALSGVAQVHLEQALGGSGSALGASGAINAVFGVLVILLPKERIYFYGLVPVPMWVAGIIFAAVDALGVLNPASSVGNIAHLSGLALGLLYGAYVKQDLKSRGLRLVRG